MAQAICTQVETAVVHLPPALKHLFTPLIKTIRIQLQIALPNLNSDVCRNPVRLFLTPCGCNVALKLAPLLRF